MKLCSLWIEIDHVFRLRVSRLTVDRKKFGLDSWKHKVVCQNLSDEDKSRTRWRAIRETINWTMLQIIKAEGADAPTLTRSYVTLSTSMRHDAATFVHIAVKCWGLPVNMTENYVQWKCKRMIFTNVCLQFHRFLRHKLNPFSARMQEPFYGLYSRHWLEQLKTSSQEKLA